MKLELPVYVEQEGSGGTARHVARSLFGPDERSAHHESRRALAKLAELLRKRLASLARASNQSAFWASLSTPAVDDQRIDLELELKRRRLRARFHFVHWQAFGRRLAFTPSHPELVFLVERGERVEERARAVLEAHYRDLERREELPPVEKGRVGVRGKSFVTTLAFDVVESQVLPRDAERDSLGLFGSGEMDGGRELARVGRLLDDLWPDELARAPLRERELERLTNALAEDAERPLLLLGRSGVGKTALLHELVRARVEARRAGGREARRLGQTWLLSPQRLISGMSYVGQWEARLLAILSEARKRKHLLAFDDLLGLYEAGLSSQSENNAGELLAGQLHAGGLALVAEMTPEAYRRFQERDRTTADRFRVLRLEEPDAPTALRMLARRVEELEERHQLELTADAVGAALDLARGPLRGQAMPGGPARLLERVCAREAGRVQQVDAARVQAELAQRTGLAPLLLSDEQRATREGLQTELHRRVIGQESALTALVDALLLTKARVADPSRPLACYLLLGPTGVGKTESVKALAGLWSQAAAGEEEQAGSLLRFDMNEYVTPEAAARLVGDGRGGDGQLTSAVRQRPWSILLLDEIEKAHPDVHDLLLQLLGEGRLTDARGRTTDFTRCMVLLTSNLGAEEAARSLGFAGEPPAAVHLEAARRFFRPELFNRIDRILTYGPLGPEQIQAVASLVLDALSRREGFARNRTALWVHPEAERQVAAGIREHSLGARALKRRVEELCVAPVATVLAEKAPEQPCWIELLPGEHAPRCIVTELPLAEPEAPLQEQRTPEDALEHAEALLAELHALRAPEADSQDSDALNAGRWEVWERDESLRALDERVGALRERLEEQSAQRPAAHLVQLSLPRSREPREASPRPGLREAMAARDVHAHVVELAGRPRPQGDALENELRGLRRELAVLALGEQAQDSGRALVWTYRPDLLGPRDTLLYRTLDAWRELPELDGHWLDEPPPGFTAVVLEGPAALAVARLEQGISLGFDPEGRMHTRLIGVEELQPEEAPDARLDALAQRTREGVGALVRGPVLRLWTPGWHVLDLRTGQASQVRMIDGEHEPVPDLRELIWSALPLDLELGS